MKVIEYSIVCYRGLAKFFRKVKMMRWKCKFFTLISFWLACLSQGLYAATLEVGFYNYPPLMIESDKSGIYHDILNEISKLTGDTFNIRYYPYPRVNFMFNNGGLDIEPGVYPGWVKDQALPGLFSVPFGKVVDVTVFNAGKAFLVKRPEDLQGKTVGMVRGYAYPNLRKLIEDGQLNRSDAVDETQLLKMLHASRFDQIIINKAVAQYSISKLAEYRYFEIGNALNSYDVCMRLSPKLEAWVPQLDRAILHLKKSGAIEKIYAKYGVHL
jgi:polar amino acid transport system substrate-binding protein